MKKKSRSSLPKVFKIFFIIVGALVGAFIWLIRKVAVEVLTTSPETHRADSKVLWFEHSTQHVTLIRKPDVELPGKYGLQFGPDRSGYLKLGEIVSSTHNTITRNVDSISQGMPVTGDPVWQKSWYFGDPTDIDPNVKSVIVESSIGILPCWQFGAGAGKWAVLVHGRGADRLETLRAVPTLRKVGYNCLVISYRNDGVATATPNGLGGLGSVEWQDLSAAIEHLIDREAATKILLVAWSMGASVSSEYLRHVKGTKTESKLEGIIFDSPALDWRVILDHQAKLNGIPEFLKQRALALIQTGSGGMITGANKALDLSDLSLSEHPERLTLPTLILHSVQDDFVPISSSQELAFHRPDLVTLQTFEEGAHVRLWNVDQTLWEDTVTRWIRKHLS